MRFVDQLVASAGHVSREHAEIALLRAAIDVHRSAERAMEEQFLGSAARGRPELGETGAQRIELGYAGQSYELQVARLGRDTYRVRVDGGAATGFGPSTKGCPSGSRSRACLTAWSETQGAAFERLLLPS